MIDKFTLAMMVVWIIIHQEIAVEKLWDIFEALAK